MRSSTRCAKNASPAPASTSSKASRRVPAGISPICTGWCCRRTSARTRPRRIRIDDPQGAREPRCAFRRQAGAVPDTRLARSPRSGDVRNSGVKASIATKSATTGPRCQPGMEWREVGAIADRRQRPASTCFNRGPHPMMVFDREGNFLRSWGEGVFTAGAWRALRRPTSTLYLTDDGDHTVRKCTTRRQGADDDRHPGRAGAVHEPASRSIAARTRRSRRTGDLYVSDGYGNARVHKYSPDGKLLLSWGEPGTDPGQFNMPHNICCDDGRLGVRRRPREPSRAGLRRRAASTRPSGTTCTVRAASTSPPRRHPICYIGELRPDHAASIARSPNLGPRVSIVDNDGKLLARLGDVERRRERAWTSSSRRTAWRWIRAVTSMSARCRLPPGRSCSRMFRCPCHCIHSRKMTKLRHRRLLIRRCRMAQPRVRGLCLNHAPSRVTSSNPASTSTPPNTAPPFSRSQIMAPARCPMA